MSERSSLRTDEASGPLQLSVRQMVGDALRAAGIAVTSSDDASATSLVNVDVLELWSDGFEVPHGKVVLEMTVLDPATHAARTKVKVEGEGVIDSAAVSSSPGCKGGKITSAHCAYFVEPMNRVYRDILRVFQEPAVRAAAIAPASTAMQ